MEARAEGQVIDLGRKRVTLEEKELLLHGLF